MVLLALVASPTAVSAQSSQLDPTFGEGGRVETAVDKAEPDWPDTGPGPTLRPESFGEDVHLATGSDGSLVVTHGNLLLRYLPDGQLDPDFGEGGWLAISTVEGLPFGLVDIAIDEEGKVLVFGTTIDPSTSRFISAYSPGEVSPSFVTVLRLNPNGALDPNFGNGGVFRTGLDLSPTPGVPANIPLVEAESAELDSEGRAVIEVGKVGFPPSIRATPGWAGAALIRLTPSGTLDPTFSGDGVVEDIHGGSEQNFLYGFCISGQDEAIIALGSDWLARFHANGSLDRGFGDKGIASLGTGGGPPVCDRSGHCFMLDGPNTYFPTRHDPSLWKVIRRSTEDGHLNRGFSRRAAVRLRGRYSFLSSLAVDRRGGVLLAGTLRLPTPDKTGRSSFFTVFRLLPSGRLDRNFGQSGRIRTSFGESASIGADIAAIDASERLVLAGSALTPWLQPGGVILARYLLD